MLLARRLFLRAGAKSFRAIIHLCKAYRCAAILLQFIIILDRRHQSHIAKRTTVQCIAHARRTVPVSAKRTGRKFSGCTPQQSAALVDFDSCKRDLPARFRLSLAHGFQIRRRLPRNRQRLRQNDFQRHSAHRRHNAERAVGGSATRQSDPGARWCSTGRSV